MVSKIIYMQQFNAAVQRKKKRVKKHIIKTNSHNNYARVRETVIATVIGKKYKNSSVSVTQQQYWSTWQNLYTPLAQAYSEATSKQGTVNCLQFFTVNYMQYGSCGITARSAYNLTYSAYNVNVQRNRSEQIVERAV